MSASDLCERLFLTSSPQLARQLRESLTLAQRQAGHAVWEAPRVYPIEVWARQFWLQSWPQLQQMHPLQELVLCEQLVAEHDAAVLSRTDLARALRQALALCAQYRIDIAAGDFRGLEQTQLQRWQLDMRERLEQCQGLSNAEVEQAAISALQAGQLKPPQQICLVGEWQDLSPAQQQLLQACESLGSELACDDPRPARPAKSIRAWRYASEPDMWLGLGAYLRDYLKVRPDAQVLLAVDNEETARAMIDPALRETLVPQHCLSGSVDLPWRYSAGTRLSQYPLVHAALQLMRFRRDSEDVESAFALLHNPVLLDAECGRQAAALDLQLRREGGDRMSLARLVAGAAAQPAWQALHQRLRAFHEVLEAAPTRALPSRWIDHLDQRLAAFGWPNVRGGLPPALHQQMEQWRDACANFQALDAQTGAVSHADATRWLREVMATRRFTPKASVQTPIQIVGLDDLPALQADLIVIAGLSEASFPRPVRRNPFVPQDLLVQAEVPYSSPADALQRARKLLRGLPQQADELLIAVPQMSASGVEITASPLLQEVLAVDFEPAPDGASALRELVASTPLLPSEEVEVPVSLQEMQEGRIRGGTQILKSTVTSPLLAFVRHRLGLRQLEDVSRLSARLQGDLAHRVLQQVFQRWPGSQALQAAEPEWDAMLEHSIDTAMQALIQPDHYGPAVLRMERGRQFGMLRKYLEHELRREHGYQVLACEARVQNVDYHGLQLDLAVDRIDRVQTPDGPRDLLIDYKTGDTSIGGWDATALREPQLPLYGTAPVLAALNQRLRQQGLLEHADAVSCDGLCFAEVHAERPAFKALSNWTWGLLDGRKRGRGQPTLVEDWPGLQQQWETRLRSLAECFLAGRLQLGEVQASDLRFEPDVWRLLHIGEPGALGDDLEDVA